MPLYDFQLVGGKERIEEFFSMATVPAVGDVIQRNGKKYRRIISRSIVNTEAVAAITHGYPYESHSLPEMPESICKKSPNGLPVVRSQQHEREIMAMTGRIRL